MGFIITGRGGHIAGIQGVRFVSVVCAFPSGWVLCLFPVMSITCNNHKKREVLGIECSYGIKHVLSSMLFSSATDGATVVDHNVGVHPQNQWQLIRFSFLNNHMVVAQYHQFPTPKRRYSNSCFWVLVSKYIKRTHKLNGHYSVVFPSKSILKTYIYW